MPKLNKDTVRKGMFMTSDGGKAVEVRAAPDPLADIKRKTADYREAGQCLSEATRILKDAATKKRSEKYWDRINNSWVYE